VLSEQGGQAQVLGQGRGQDQAGVGDQAGRVKVDAETVEVVRPATRAGPSPASRR
jgi:hypothetical protein